MKNLKDLISLSEQLTNYLINNEIRFDENGFPILKREMFLNEEPELIVPYNHRNNKLVTNKKKTAICFFTGDTFIYRRLKKVFDEIDIYQSYMGVVMPDITVTDDMDLEWQNFIILINQLFIAVLAVNGVKILFNTRAGNTKTYISFKNVPENIICVSSFLGCGKSNEFDNKYITKILSLLPSKLLIYGKEDNNINKMLDVIGIDYKYYTDFHQLSKGGGKYGR